MKLLNKQFRNSMPNSVSGVGLIEVLVSILVLGVGALGVASMQLTGLKYNTGTQGRTLAVFMANDMMDRMRANRDLAMESDAYVITDFSVVGAGGVAAPTVDCYDATCTPEQTAEFDKFYFVNQVQQLLPLGKAKITFTGEGIEKVAEVSLQWTNVAARQDREGFTPTDDELAFFSFKSAL